MPGSAEAQFISGGTVKRHIHLPGYVRLRNYSKTSAQRYSLLKYSSVAREVISSLRPLLLLLLLIAYFMGNISAKQYQNLFKFVRVVANWLNSGKYGKSWTCWDVRHSVIQ